MKIRLLLVNPNTNKSITDSLAIVVRASVSKDIEICTATASFGFSVIQTADELVVAQQALIETVHDHVLGCDGVLVGISLDIAIDKLQALWKIPIVGMTGGALVTLERQGLRVGVITFGVTMTKFFRHTFPSVNYQLIEMLDTSPEEALAQRNEPRLLLKALEKSADNLALRGAQAVLLIGATASGLASQISARVPVIDSVAYAAKELERLVKLKKISTL